MQVEKRVAPHRSRMPQRGSREPV